MGRLSASPVNYWGGFAVDVAGSLALIGWGVAASDRGALAAVVACGLGALWYSFCEYALHRWLYHGQPSAVSGVHALHHGQAHALIGAPFFFAPAVCLLNWGLAALVVDGALAAVFAATVLVGYWHQSVIHHLAHGARARGPGWCRRLRRHHRIHHRQDGVNFGVSTTLWDHVFSTAAPRRARPRDGQPA